MRLADFTSRMPDMVALPPPLRAAWQAAGGVEVIGITADSRQVRHGMIFAAVPGAVADGRMFIPQAVARGAAAVLAAPGTPMPADPYCPLLPDPEPRRRLARLAALFAGPQPRIVVAVTGTNGKTSVVDFLRQLWALAGRKAASLGTLGVIAPGRPGGGGLTTPDPVALAAEMTALSRAGVEHAAIEASSHGLDQCRLDGLRLEAGAITNLTRDHLDYHGDMARYRAAKLRLFQTLLPPRAPVVAGTALDAETMEELSGIAARRRHRLLTVGAGGSHFDLRAVQALPGGQMLALADREIALNLPGRFQADNALMAAALAEATGVADALDLLPGLVGVRGRLELAAMLPNGAAIYVDFAHTPDALDRLIAALRPHATGHLHIVFGAGGDRDPGKRPLMGAAAAAADRVILTDDNPRSEDPAAIRAAVLVGCPGAMEIGGREAAIAAAMSDLGPGDVLVVAGKGHEQGQTIAGITHPFDDAAVIRRLAGTA